MKEVSQKKTSLADKLCGLVYPEHLRCIVCGDELTHDTRYDLCDRCKFARIENRCRVCGKALPPQNSICEDCAATGNHFTAARSPFVYDGEVAKLVRRFKYHDARYLARPMAEHMYDVFLETDWHVDVVTSVPLHRTRQLWRGYNQSELLAREVGKRIDRPVAVCLRKTVRSINMARLNRAERLKRIVDTFALADGTDVAGKSVLLVDDVLTTGATTSECARVLRGAGALAVYVLTFASGKIKLPQTI